MMPDGAMLRIDDLAAGYGDARVLHGITLELAEGRVLAVLGRNGAGKTTLLKAIMGLLPRSQGSIRFAGAELLGLSAHRIPRLGIGYVPQGRRLFAELTVAENLEIGRYARRPEASGPWASREDRAVALFPALAERWNQRAGSLSGGEQQMLAIARALNLRPRLLLVDEPTEGLMPRMVTTILDTIAALKAQGVAVILVEQRVELALGVADDAAILENGRLAAVVGSQALRNDPALLGRHLGLDRGA
jgi:branched-chain amino acid transport system ATP-binding protein